MAMQLGKDAKSNSEAYKAGKAMAATGIEILKDGTFVLVFAGHQCKGDWKFDKQTGEVELKVKSAEPLLPVPGGNARRRLSREPIRRSLTRTTHVFDSSRRRPTLQGR